MRRLYIVPQSESEEPLLTIKQFFPDANESQLQAAEKVAVQLWNETYTKHEDWQKVRNNSGMEKRMFSPYKWKYPLIWLEEFELALLGQESSEASYGRARANKVLNSFFKLLPYVLTHEEDWLSYDIAKEAWAEFLSTTPVGEIMKALSVATPPVRSIGTALQLTLQYIARDQYLSASDMADEIKRRELPEILRRFV